MSSCLHLLTCACLKPRRRKSQGQASAVDRSISGFDTSRDVTTGEGAQKPTVYSTPRNHEQENLNAIAIGTARSDSYYDNHEPKDEFEVIRDRLQHVSPSHGAHGHEILVPTSIYSTISATAAHDYNAGHLLPQSTRSTAQSQIPSQVRHEQHESKPGGLETGSTPEYRVPFTASSTSDYIPGTTYTPPHAQASVVAGMPSGSIFASTEPTSNHVHNLIPSSQSISLTSSSNQNQTALPMNTTSYPMPSTSSTAPLIATPDLGKPLGAVFDQLPITPISDNESQVSGPQTRIQSSNNPNEDSQWPHGRMNAWPYNNNPAPASVKRWYDSGPLASPALRDIEPAVDENRVYAWGPESSQSQGGSNLNSNIPTSTVLQPESVASTAIATGQSDKSEEIRSAGNSKRESAKTEEDRLREFVFM